MIKVDYANKFTAVATSTNSILIYDNSNYNLLTNFVGHTGFIYDIAFNPDKERFALYSGSEDGTVKVWDIILNKCSQTLVGHKASVRFLSLTNDGKNLISVSADNHIILWKLSNYSVIKSFNFDQNIESLFYFTRVSTGANNREISPYLLIGSEDGSLTEVNLKKDGNFPSIKQLNQPVSYIHYASQIDKLFYLTSEQTIVILGVDLVNSSIKQAELIKIYPAYCQEVLDIKVENKTKHGGFLFATNDNVLKHFNTQTAEIKMFEGHNDFVMNIDIKGDYISTSSKDTTIRVWKIDNESATFDCNCIAVLKGHNEAVNCSALIIKKNLQVVSAGKDQSIKVWDLTSINGEISNKAKIIKQSIHSELAHDEEVSLVKVSPNEKLIASGSYDKQIKVK